MSYQCPKGHISTDPDYCSECGARISISSASAAPSSSSAQSPVSEEICPDCGTPRVGDARFCEVCRHDFIEGSASTAEKVVEAQKAPQEIKPPEAGHASEADAAQAPDACASPIPNIMPKDEIILAQKLDVIISVDQNRLAQNQVETSIKPDSIERVFPLDLDENLVGRRSLSKGIYPEIEINDPGVSHRHLKFIKQSDGSFAALELGSANGTELNGAELQPGVSTAIKAGDEFHIGLWTALKIVSR